MAYITRTELRSYIGITSSTHDTVLDGLIASASEVCDIYTQRTYGTLGSGFLTHTNTNERHWITNEARVVLEEWPIVSVAAATLRGSTVTLNSDFYLRTGEGIMTFYEGSGYKQRETGPVVITYIAGYTSVPDAVKECCLRLGSFWFGRKSAEGLGSQLMGDMQETFRAPETKRILQEELEYLRLNALSHGGI